MNPLSINPLHLLAACVIASAVGFGGGWSVNGWRLGTTIAELKTTHATEKAAQATATVTTMQSDAAAIHKAAVEFSAIQNTLGPKFDSLKNEVKNAKPLPAGCKPDDVRVRNLEAAIDAANKSATGQ